MNSKYKKFAFTLAELMICMAVLGALFAILIPTLNPLKPNKQKAMFKKSFSTASRIMYELANNEELYPTDNNYVGLDNRSRVTYDDVNYGSNVANSAEAGSKFCKLFMLKMNMLADNSAAARCQTNHSGLKNSNDYTFITPDGVAWGFENNMFAVQDRWYRVSIDVDGISQGINCFDRKNSSSCNQAWGGESYSGEVCNGSGTSSDFSGNCTTSETDRYYLCLRADGKIKAVGPCARQYVREATLLRRK